MFIAPDLNSPQYKKEVAERLFFIEDRVSLLHEFDLDLVSQGTQSSYFVQVLSREGRILFVLDYRSAGAATTIF